MQVETSKSRHFAVSEPLLLISIPEELHVKGVSILVPIPNGSLPS